MKDLLNKILDETVAYYDTKDKLAKDEVSGHCEYLTEEGNKCAVGRYFTDGTIELIRTIQNTKIEEMPVGLIVLSDAIKGDVFDLEAVMPLKDVLIDEVKDVPVVFWNELQSLHDSHLHQGGPGSERTIARIKDRIDKGGFIKNK